MNYDKFKRSVQKDDRKQAKRNTDQSSKDNHNKEDKNYTVK